ncbi:hypothetical protein BRC2024_KCUCJSVR_CDS_0022 [Acinetobacter phage vB_AbaM_KissB]|uniref:Uncharacterized protein n=1 Tax=Acinetobacter phage vB_AbaM_B09_Aci05 TaxID=2315458 RepID=A0A386KDS8_9CAUD|nr:hypothetical protein HOU35_gp019 [Acinetobacter phage vB_AbaM_B09_Aci05]AYD82454.1 hypothetical protein Aci05_158 [Acinetobacter phage vB_AbaM_B09_Aci05]QMP19006.1 hypothetical protein FKOIJHOC_00058 [Acinetobacter phage Ab_121]
MIKRDLYQDKYNPRKTWQVNHMKGAKYLKQFIDGVQYGKGIRCNMKFIKQIGIDNFKLI